MNVGASRSARVRIKALVGFVLLLAILACGAYAGRQWRRQVLTARALEAGHRAYQQEDFADACEHYRRYLGRCPTDAEVLEKYARARLSMDPIEPGRIADAAGAYRRLLTLRSADTEVCRRLVRLYAYLQQFDEVIHVAGIWSQREPRNAEPRIGWAKALAAQQKPDEAVELLSRVIEQANGFDRNTDRMVEACLILSGLAAQSRSDPQSFANALAWLDRALEIEPQSAQTLLARASFYRKHPQVAESHEAAAALARGDLVAAETLTPTNPRLRLALAAEWMEHGELNRAQAIMDALADVNPAALRADFVDPADWIVARVSVAAHLTLRRTDRQRAGSLAQETLSALTQKRHRFAVLPLAVELYLAAGRPAEAKSCLEEYRQMVALLDPTQLTGDPVLLLEAAVARAENKPYRVIQLLTPLAARNAAGDKTFRMLAEAFGETDQPHRTIQALRQYLRLQPHDKPAMVQLVREYLKQSQWTRAMETARIAESMPPTDATTSLLRIEAALRASEAENDRERDRLEALANELHQLRSRHPAQLELRILQALAAFKLQKPDEAETELKLIIQEGGQTLPAELLLAQILGQRQRSAEAMQICRSACQRHAQTAAPWRALAELHQDAGDPQAARAALAEGVRTITDPSERRRLAIRLHLSDILQGDRSAGVAGLKALADGDPRDLHVRQLLLQLPEMRHDPELAQTLIDQIRNLEGDNGLVWQFQQARFWLAREDWRSREGRIADVLSRCIAADPEWSAPVLLLGRMHEQLGNADEAERIYRNALAANPAAVDVADRLAAMLERYKRFTEAQLVLNALEPASDLAARHRLRIALASDDLDQAITELRLRLDANPNDAGALVLLARLLYRHTGNDDEALALLDQARSLAPDSVQALAARAAILRAQDKTHQAIQILDDAVEQNPDFPTILLRASFLTAAGRPDRAEQDYQRLTSFSEHPESHELLGSFYMGAGRTDEAIAAWECGLRAAPDRLQLAISLLNALLARGTAEDVLRANRMLAQLEQSHPEHPDVLWIRARTLMADGQAAHAASDLLEQIVKAKPAFVEAHLALIQLAFNAREYEQARQLAMRGLGDNPQAVPLLIAAANAEWKLGHLDAAAGMVRMARDQEPNNPDAAAILAELALQTGDPQTLTQAHALTAGLLRHHSRSDRLWLAHSALLDALGKDQEAVSVLTGYCQSDAGRDSVAAMAGLVELRRRQGNLAEAETLLNSASPGAADTPPLLRERLLLLAARKDFEELSHLASDLGNRQRPDPDLLTYAAAALASSASSTHRQQAARLFEQALQLAPNLVTPHVGLALLCYQDRRVDRAEELYRAALRLDPDNLQALNDLAWILVNERGNCREALELADRGLRLSPDNPHLRDTRGVILLNMDDRLEDARRDFQKCVELAARPDAARAKALLQLGRVCLRLHDRSQARRHFQEALQIDRQLQVFTPQERSEAVSLSQPPGQG